MPLSANPSDGEQLTREVASGFVAYVPPERALPPLPKKLGDVTGGRLRHFKEELERRRALVKPFDDQIADLRAQRQELALVFNGATLPRDAAAAAQARATADTLRDTVLQFERDRGQARLSVEHAESTLASYWATYLHLVRELEALPPRPVDPRVRTSWLEQKRDGLVREIARLVGDGSAQAT